MEAGPGPGPGPVPGPAVAVAVAVAVRSAEAAAAAAAAAEADVDPGPDAGTAVRGRDLDNDLAAEPAVALSTVPGPGLGPLPLAPRESAIPSRPATRALQNLAPIFMPIAQRISAQRSSSPTPPARLTIHWPRHQMRRSSRRGRPATSLISRCWELLQARPETV